MKKRLIIFIVLMMFSMTIVYATTIKFDSNDVFYNNSASGLSSEYLKDALDTIDEKYTERYSNCPKNMKCTSNTPKCKRATSLHTETCQQSSGYCAYAEGYENTISYGSLGTNGTLATGDAFDCDLDGNGEYNSENERFYYVSDYYDTSSLTFNEGIAVLIYYASTYNGIISDSAGAQYHSNNANYAGPGAALTHLPTWNNISLYKERRQIIKDNNTNSTVFTYSGKSARLLTYQELYYGCFNTDILITSGLGLKKCNFLFENTKYSNETASIANIWLETPYNQNSQSVYNYSSGTLQVSRTSANSTFYSGIHPVIEIKKTEISY